MHAKRNRDTVPQVINGRINGRFAKGFSTPLAHAAANPPPDRALRRP
jgi:hypothetical protein